MTGPIKSFNSKETIAALVRTAVESFTQGFQARHETEVDNHYGIINMKIYNKLGRNNDLGY